VQQLTTMAKFIDCSPATLKDAATSLIRGNLVAFPTETVYGLGADATNESAIARVFEVKGRPKNHPLIVHISSIKSLDMWAVNISDYAIKLAKSFWPGPMTLILPRSDLAKDFITGGQDNVGIRVPAHAAALELLKEFESQGGYGVAAPSANRFGKVSPTCAEDVRTELYSKLKIGDVVLDGGSSLVGVESTIINCLQPVPTILRPGAVTVAMINKLLDLNIDIKSKDVNNKIKSPGVLDSHYSPVARVHLSGVPKPGDGLIALASFPTPFGVIRLAKPDNNEDYAHELYKALRLADSKKIQNIFVIPPIGGGISVAINDRLYKASKAYN
jgi:L-threonylcarbamoyladenylate synthase